LISGGRIRYRSLADVLAEMDFLDKEYGVQSFTFADDNFTWDRDRAMALFKALEQRPGKICFTFPNGVREDSLDEELLRTMERAGCSMLGLGIESGSDETLKRMKKSQTRAKTIETVNLIRRTTNMRIIGSVILGYPGETIDDVKETIRFTISLPIHNAHFCLYIPIPGTPVYLDLLKEGFFTPDQCDPDTLTMDKPSLSLPGLPPDQLLRLHQMAYLRFYSRPWRAIDLLRQIQSPGQFRVIWRRFLKLFF
jgi:radical SAM superfamily enzyme YgiQ (UPF0313 family)